uniref:Uncharacterized protein n=1 Tax=Glossina brevipalpis TaxID=37001 RepID=A0A1A9X4M4_9MUSC
MRDHSIVEFNFNMNYHRIFTIIVIFAVLASAQLNLLAPVLDGAGKLTGSNDNPPVLSGTVTKTVKDVVKGVPVVGGILGGSTDILPEDTLKL